jgi:hypothetical protein
MGVPCSEQNPAGFAMLPHAQYSRPSEAYRPVVPQGVDVVNMVQGPSSGRTSSRSPTLAPLLGPYKMGRWGYEVGGRREW